MIRLYQMLQQTNTITLMYIYMRRSSLENDTFFLANGFTYGLSFALILSSLTSKLLSLMVDSLAILRRVEKKSTNTVRNKG